MSIYTTEIPEDLEDVFSDDHGFWENHNVNGVTMRAIVHAGALTPRAALVDLGTFGADKVCIVRASDYTGGLPEIDSVFLLDDEEFRVSAASMLGGLCLKISLQRVEG